MRLKRERENEGAAGIATQASGLRTAGAERTIVASEKQGGG